MSQRVPDNTGHQENLYFSLEPEFSLFLRHTPITDKALINEVHTKSNLLQTSDCSRHCPLLAVRDLHQHQSYHR
jgi:hypothetical protein